MEIAADLAPVGKQDYYRLELEKYKREKEEIKAKAETLDRNSEAANQASERAMRPHHHLAQAMTLIQIAISLASVTALTRARWLLGFAALAAVTGIGLWALV